jgi:hypothetical protein
MSRNFNIVINASRDTKQPAKTALTIELQGH